MMRGMPALPLILALSLALSPARAVEPEGPTFEVRSDPRHEVQVQLAPDLLAALEELMGLPPLEDGPLRLSATRRTPSLPITDALQPHPVSERSGPPEQAAFLLELSRLVPPAEMDPRTAGQLADVFFTEARERPGTPEGERWMAAALPLYRQAATGPMRHPERLALRLAWAARLGGGDREDLVLAERLLDQGAEESWAAEARLVLADAMAQPATWDSLGALTQLERAQQNPALEAVVWARYAESWAWYNVGELGRAIEMGKEAVRVARDEGGDAAVLNAALRDLADHVLELGDLWDEGFGRLDSRLVQAFLERMLQYELSHHRVDQALQVVYRLHAEQGDIRPFLPALIDAAAQLTPELRFEVYDRLLNLLVPGLASSQDPADQALKAQLSAAIAAAAAELYYEQYGRLRPQHRAVLLNAFAYSLKLDPQSPRRAAIERVQAELARAAGEPITGEPITGEPISGEPAP